MWQQNYTEEEADEDEENVDCQTLTDACLLLFGDETVVSPAFFSYMQIAGLRSAFRSLAMRNHPDLALQIGVDADVLQNRFNAIRKAYELLLPYVAGEKSLPEWSGEKVAATAETPPPRNSRWTAKPAAPTPEARLKPYRNVRAGNERNHTFAYGKVPRRVLRLGEFLYYNRKISWENLFSALVWQRLSRPRLGEIALEKRMLKAGDMMDIRRFRQPNEMMGETAVRMGLISATQLRMLLGYQKLYNCPIGRYFVEEKILRSHELNQYLQLQRHHNLCFQTQKYHVS